MAPRNGALTIRQVAARWGVSTTTIYRLVNRDELHAFKVGLQWRIPLREVERFEVERDGALDDELARLDEAGELGLP